MDGTGFDGVTLVRDGTTVLRDVTLSAGDGELLVVLGPSGSGKSSLLRALAGLDPVASGEVLIKGRTVTGLPSGERRVAMVFESVALVPFLDVSRNLGWGLRVQGVPEPEIEERVSDRSERLRLGRLLPRRPGQLSRGERGLVGIGRALVQIPDVFLLDEPLSHLDAANRMRSRRQIVDVVRELGVTTIYVTHDQAEALAVADRIALLHGGRVLQLGRPMELYDRPLNLVVAGFVGSPSIGLLSARLVVADGMAGFQVGPRTLPLWRPLPEPMRAHAGRDVVLGFRPEDVHPASTVPAAETVSLRGLVTAVEYTGRNHVVSVAVDGPAVTAPGADLSGSTKPALRALFPGDAEVRPGDDAQLAVDGTRAHVFDPATGQAIWHPLDGDDPPS